jgi:hypothetical protein
MTICRYSNKSCQFLKLCSLSKSTPLQQPRKWDFDTNGNPYYTDLPACNKNHTSCQHPPIVSQLAKIEPKESRLTVKKPYPILK